MGWTSKVDQEPRVARSTRLKSSAQQPCAGAYAAARVLQARAGFHVSWERTQRSGRGPRRAVLGTSYVTLGRSCTSRGSDCSSGR